MKKRALAAVLWFYSAWYAGAMIAHVLGLAEALGLILGTAAAGIIVGDPRHRIWNRRSETPTQLVPDLNAQQA